MALRGQAGRFVIRAEGKRLGLPHGGVRPSHQKSTGLTQLTLGPYVVQIWSRNTLKQAGRFVIRAEGKRLVVRHIFTPEAELHLTATSAVPFFFFITLEPRVE